MPPGLRAAPRRSRDRKSIADRAMAPLAPVSVFTRAAIRRAVEEGPQQPVAEGLPRA